MNKKFELYKICREIKMHGEKYLFRRIKKDDYEEDTKEFEDVANISAIFHTVKGYISQNKDDGAEIHSKGQPKLLCAFEDAKDINNGDIVSIKDDDYKVVEKNDIEKFGIVCDISLEVILNGRN